MDWLWAAEAGAEGQRSGYWQLAMILLGIGLLGMFGRWRKAKHQNLPTAKEIRSRDTNPNRYRDAADRAIVEMLEMSRTLNAQVDTKIRLLNRLVKDAEEKSARLEQLLRQVDPALEQAKPPEPETPATAAESARLKKSASSRTFVSELQERIHLLHNEGKSVAEIAKATNLSTTEVKFALESMKVE